MIKQFLVLLLSSVFLIQQTAAADPAKPNFVVINIDDLGYRDIGPFGSNNKTPNLDRMAREGRKLTSHYAAPVCSPSRAALMTGCYPKRVLPIPGVLFPAAAVGLNPDETTIAEILKDAGYRTACIGKWHLGDQPEFLPTRQGFDYYFGIPYSNDMGPAFDGAKSNPDKPLPTREEVAAKAAKAKQQSTSETGIAGAGQPPLPLLENEKVIERVRGAEQRTLVKRYTEKAVQFIREHKDGPFFVYLPHSAVHFPHYPSQPYVGRSPNGLVGDWAEEVDWGVGQVLDALRELKLAERTLVIFTSDNGGPVQQGANNAPLRGSKASTWEGGVRVCTIAWWPGQVPAASSTDAITSMMDILPTLARLSGTSVKANKKIDGVDIWPVLAGTAEANPPRQDFYYYRGLALEAVRLGKWKLHLAGSGDQPGKKAASSAMLFNLADDIGEAHNVAADHADIVQKLQSMADSTDKDLGVRGIGPGCRPLGRNSAPKPLIDDDGNVREGFVGPTPQFP
jgi:arylsulfatase A